MLEIIIAVVVGVIVGGLVNALADELPYRTFFGKTITPPDDATDEEIQEYADFNVILAERNRRGYLPVYPDGTPRPFLAWWGLSAFALGLREPKTPQPDAIRERPHRDSKKLSWRHPVTELMTGLFFGLVAYGAPSVLEQYDVAVYSAQYWLYFVYMAIFALVIVIDMEHKLILFVVIIPAIVIALLDAYFLPEPWPGFFDAVVGAGAGFALFFGLYLFGFVFRWYMNRFRGRNITTVVFGYGDVLMLTLSGALLGLLNTLMAMVVTILLGAAGGLTYLIMRKLAGDRDVLTSAIPYGPYIVIATLMMMLFGDAVWAFMT